MFRKVAGGEFGEFSFQVRADIFAHDLIADIVEYDIRVMTFADL